MENIMNFRRLYFFMETEILENLKSYIINLAGVNLFFFLIFWLKFSEKGFSYETYLNLFPFFYFLMGLIFTSRIFTKVNSKFLNHDFLMLPVSNFEKFLGLLLMSTIVYTIAYFLFFTFTTIIVALFFHISGKLTMEVFNPFSIEVLNIFSSYIVIHCVFFFGAVLFKKSNFVKTIISMILFLILLMLSSAWFIFKFENAGSWTMNFVYSFEDFLLYGGNNLGISFTSFFLYFILIPFFWGLSFYKMKNIEVKDGV